MKNWIGILVSYFAIFLVILIAKIFEKMGKEASRKFIHIALGNWWLIAMYFFDNVWFAIIPPATFVIINYLSYKKNIIKVMEREENEQEGLGTVYYAIALLIVAIITFGIVKKPILGLISIFVMAYGDGFAAIIGKSVKSYKFKINDTEKSIAGSITMFIISFIIISIYLGMIKSSLWIVKSIICSLVLTLIEAVSTKGTDNLDVPLTCLIMMLII